MSRVFCNLVTPTSYNVYRSSDSLYSYCYRDFIEIIGVLALDQTHNFGLHKQRLSSTLKGSPPKKPSLDTVSGSYLLSMPQRYGILSCLLPNIHIQRSKRVCSDVCVRPSDNNCSNYFTSRSWRSKLTLPTSTSPA